MINPNTLKLITSRMSKLTREYDAAAAALNPRANTIIEELCQLTAVRDSLKSVEGKAAAAGKQTLVKFESLFRTMEIAARQIARMRSNDPQRHEVVNELTRLVIIADSVNIPRA